ncbi:hypothetical protein J6590_073488 [Homalodisca vitripennis]|nr:hypothetical protein J6590_073488 [Homalodisca vitripennis]
MKQCAHCDQTSPARPGLEFLVHQDTRIQMARLTLAFLVCLCALPDVPAHGNRSGHFFKAEIYNIRWTLGPALPEPYNEVRIIGSLTFGDSCRDAFRSLGLLTLPCLYILEVALYCRYKCELTQGGHGRDNLRVQSHRTIAYEQLPSQFGVKVINRLPECIKELATKKRFKARDLLCQLFTLQPKRVKWEVGKFGLSIESSTPEAFQFLTFETYSEELIHRMPFLHSKSRAGSCISTAIYIDTSSEELIHRMPFLHSKSRAGSFISTTIYIDTSSEELIHRMPFLHSKSRAVSCISTAIYIDSSSEELIHRMPFLHSKSRAGSCISTAIYIDSSSEELIHRMPFLHSKSRAGSFISTTIYIDTSSEELIHRMPFLHSKSRAGSCISTAIYIDSSSEELIHRMPFLHSKSRAGSFISTTIYIDTSSEELIHRMPFLHSKSRAGSFISTTIYIDTSSEELIH